jgi:hypothetical protein
VELVGQPPECGENVLLVFHAKHKRALARSSGRLTDAVLVGVRADNREPLEADFEILQNGRFANNRRRFHVSHWPQPGLIPRDPARGTGLLRVAYKGFDRNLHPTFREPRWRELLAARGIEWVVDSVEFAGDQTDHNQVQWNDFSTIDAVVAVRPCERHLYRSKPATKLYNAWHAGVPAILGPEHGYRELRRSPLDYLEVSSVAEAEQALVLLQEDHALYNAMVEHGRRRAAELSVEAICAQWRRLLFEEIPRRAGSPSRRAMRRCPMPLRVALRRLARTATLRPPR